MQKRGLVRQIVHNSAAVKHICFKFGTNVLNWTLYDPRNSFLKQTPDGEIIEYFLKGCHFLCPTLYIRLFTLFSLNCMPISASSASSIIYSRCTNCSVYTTV